MNKIDIYNALQSITANTYLDEPMKKHTSFKTGGNADVLVKPINIEELKRILDYCKNNNIEYIVIGNGTNLLVKDGGLRKVVIKISDNMNLYRLEGNRITASAGASLIGLSIFAYNNGLSGLEFACGIPGTLGGAIRMNAGAFKGEMSQVVEETTYMNLNGEIFTCKGLNEHRFEYRCSVFAEHDDYIILEAKLKLEENAKEKIKELMDHNTEIRKNGQPINYPSAGSTFKRPEGYFPGKLIEDAGLKGYRIGGAEVSTLHANFIINIDNATSSDILQLMKYVQDTVHEKFNVLLEPEVNVIGEDI